MLDHDYVKKLMPGLIFTAKKESKQSDVTKTARARQEQVLELIKDEALHVPVIAKRLGVSAQVARLDVRSLLARGKIKNHAVGRTAYYVKAV